MGTLVVAYLIKPIMAKRNRRMPNLTKIKLSTVVSTFL